MEVILFIIAFITSIFSSYLLLKKPTELKIKFIAVFIIIMTGVFLFLGVILVLEGCISEGYGMFLLIILYNSYHIWRGFLKPKLAAKRKE